MGTGFEIHGMDEFEKKMKRMNKNVNNIKKEVSQEQLLNNKFMKKYTKYSSLQEMYEKSGFNIKTEKDFAAIPNDEWNEFINKNTKFSNWQQMGDKAQEEYIIHQVNNAIHDI